MRLRLAELRRVVSEAGAEGEPFHVGGEQEREPLAVRPAVVLALRQRNEVVAVVLRKERLAAHGAYPHKSMVDPASHLERAVRKPRIGRRRAPGVEKKRAHHVREVVPAAEKISAASASAPGPLKAPTNSNPSSIRALTSHGCRAPARGRKRCAAITLISTVAARGQERGMAHATRRWSAAGACRKRAFHTSQKAEHPSAG